MDCICKSDAVIHNFKSTIPSKCSGDELNKALSVACEICPNLATTLPLPTTVTTSTGATTTGSDTTTTTVGTSTTSIQTTSTITETQTSTPTATGTDDDDDDDDSPAYTTPAYFSASVTTSLGPGNFTNGTSTWRYPTAAPSNQTSSVPYKNAAEADVKPGTGYFAGTALAMGLMALVFAGF
jgi:hypothetical protein